ncbi:glycosyltransferase family 4 protein [Chloroflexota bacterium]
MNKNIFINGRMVRSQITGSSRYTLEVSSRIKHQANLLKPPKFARLGKGILWEQIFLPFRVGKSKLLWSPANTGPLAVANQVITIHDLIPLETPKWYTSSYTLWYRFLLPKLAQRAIKIITDSQYSKGRIKYLFNLPEDLLVVIPCGVGEEFRAVNNLVKDKVLSKYGINPYYIVSVGTLEPRKNLNRLFQAWKSISSKLKQVTLVVIGTEANSIIDTGINEIPDSTKLLGYVPDTDLPALYSGAKALVFPSLYEGFGLPILEAMACGTPVIASNATAIPEVVGDAGLLFDPRDIEEIASKMIQIIQNEELRLELHHKGLQRSKQFTWDKTANQVWEVLVQSLEETQYD